MNYVSLLLLSFLFHSTNFFEVTAPSEKAMDTYSDSISVYLFLSDECVICKDYAPYLNDLRNTYSSDNLSFIGVFPNFASKKTNIQVFKEKYNIQYATRTDYFKKLVNKFDVKVTPEVVVYDEIEDKILYQGRIDNKYYSLGKRRRVITKHELEDALSSITSQSQVIEPKTIAIGCFINQVDKIIN